MYSYVFHRNKSLNHRKVRNITIKKMYQLNATINATINVTIKMYSTWLKESNIPSSTKRNVAGFRIKFGREIHTRMHPFSSILRALTENILVSHKNSGARMHIPSTNGIHTVFTAGGF